MGCLINRSFGLQTIVPTVVDTDSTAIIIDDSGSTAAPALIFARGPGPDEPRIIDFMAATAKRLRSENPGADVFSMTHLHDGTASPLSSEEISALNPGGGTPLYKALARAFGMGYERFYVICDGQPNGGLQYPDQVVGLPMPPISSIRTILVDDTSANLSKLFDPMVPDNFFVNTTIDVHITGRR